MGIVLNSWIPPDEVVRISWLTSSQNNLLMKTSTVWQVRNQTPGPCLPVQFCLHQSSALCQYLLSLVPFGSDQKRWYFCIPQGSADEAAHTGGDWTLVLGLSHTEPNTPLWLRVYKCFRCLLAKSLGVMLEWFFHNKVCGEKTVLGETFSGNQNIQPCKLPLRKRTEAKYKADLQCVGVLCKSRLILLVEWLCCQRVPLHHFQM